MAKKLSEDLVSRIEALGIIVKTKTEEEARPKLIAHLAKHDLQGVEDDPINELVEFCEVLGEDEVETKPLPKAAAPAVKGKKVVEPEPEEEEEETEEEQLDGLAEELEEEEEEVVAKPAKKAAAPVVATKAKTAPAAVKTVAKPAKTEPVKASGGGREVIPGEKFDARNNKKHLAFIKPFEAFFPEEDFEITLLKQGFTVRVLGKNAKTTILNFDELKIVDGKLAGNVYTNRFKSVEDLFEVLPEEYQEKEVGMFRMESHPSIRKVSQDELFDIFENSELVRTSLDRANAKDVKMGVNRERLEETLKQGTPAKTAPKVVAKPAVKTAAVTAKTVAKKK